MLRIQGCIDLESWSPARKHLGGPHYKLTHPPRIQVLRITFGLSSPLSFHCVIILQCAAKFHFVGFSAEHILIVETNLVLGKN